MAVHSDPEAQAAWALAVDKVKQGVIAPALWRALEKTVPVIWEDDNFVVGMPAVDGLMARQLNTREYSLAIERALRETTHSATLTLRVVEGTEVSDWEYVKARDAAALASRQQVVERRQRESTSFGSWDQVYDQVSRLWANSEYRGLPSGRARFFDNALDIVEKSMATLYPADGKTDETTERGLSRVLDRIANMTSSDPAVIGYMLLLRRQRSSGSDNGGE